MPRKWFIILLLLTLAVGATRLAALPGSLWHQDEAEFASAVLNFDITWNRPHPPWFPLWIVLGKIAHAGGVPAGRSLQILSAVFSTATLLPLFFLWSIWLRRELALAASLLFLLLPGVWMLSGRAFSDTPALALLAVTLACWLEPGAGRGKIALGSVLAGLTVLVRPHHVVLLAGPMIVAWRRGADRRALLGPAALLGVSGAAGLVLWGGPPSLLWKALRLIGQYQRSLLETASHPFSSLGLARILLHPWLGGVWMALSVFGAIVLLRSRRPAAGALVWAAAVPAAAVLLVFFDPVEPRYWLPVLALSSGLVVVAAASVLRVFSLPATGLALAGCAWAVIPALPTFHHEVSPPFRAIAEAQRLAQRRRWAIVADLNIRPFAELERFEGRLANPIVYDVELGRGAGIPPPWSVAALYTDSQDRFIVDGGPPEVFHSRTPLLERLIPGPYLTTTVVPAARVRPARRRTHNQPPEE